MSNVLQSEKCTDTACVQVMILLLSAHDIHAELSGQKEMNEVSVTSAVL